MQQAAEVKVGIFVVAVVAIGVFVVSQLKGGLAGSSRGYDFEIWFDNAPGVGTGSPVRLSGVDIGEVLKKDIVTVNESISFTAAPSDEVADVYPFERVVTWTAGEPKTDGFVSLEVGRKRVTAEQRRRQAPYSRERSLARLQVKIRAPYELFERYQYSITGGILIGDKQLEVSDVGPDGLPMAVELRGNSVKSRRDQGQRVAVLGSAPPNVDKIVGTVEDTLDEETTGRVKQIVGNIERATDEAAELILALRTTVQGNQANADVMMTNLAKASDQIKVGVTEARTLAAESLANVERLTATGRRVAENNEERMNRIVADVQSTTGSVARLARESEPRIAATLDETRAIVGEVRSMISANRENFDQIATRMASAADNLAGISEESRGQVQGLLSSANQAVQEVRSLLETSDRELSSLFQSFGAAAGDIQAMTGELRASLPPVTENLTATSANIRDASANVARMTGDERLDRILNNIEATTAEAQGMIQDLRSLTGDEEIHDNIRTTTREVRDLTTNVNRTLGGLAAYRPSVLTDVYYIPDESRWQGDVRLDVFTRGRSSFHIAAENVTSDPLWSAQLGTGLTIPGLRARYGFYRGQLGVGADYQLSSLSNLYLNWYDPEDPQVDLRFTYKLPWGITGLVGIEDATDGFDWTWGVRIGRELP